jgi:hypothetical protein
MKLREEVIYVLGTVLFATLTYFILAISTIGLGWSLAIWFALILFVMLKKI